MIYDLFSDRTKAYRIDRDFLKAIQKISKEKETVLNAFNEATDPLLIEALIYRLKEIELIYSYLIKIAKTERLCGNINSGGDCE